MKLSSEAFVHLLENWWCGWIGNNESQKHHPIYYCYAMNMTFYFTI